MTIEQDYVIARGNVYAQFNSSELKIGLVGSLSKKRHTLHRGLESFAEIFKYVEFMLGDIPEITVGFTNKKMAKFAEKRFGMDVKLVNAGDSGHKAYMVTGDTRNVASIVISLIPNDNQ